MIWLMAAFLLGVQTPARDAAVGPRPGTGVIAGTVLLDDADARPLRRVQVMLNTGLAPLPRAALTDDAGRFIFIGLPPGNYVLQANRVGYVTAFYGAKKPGRGPGIPISVADGQRVPDVTLKMLRGAAITGVVRLPGGKPASGVNVNANSVTTANGRYQVEAGSSGGFRSVTTDDRGEYRIYGLAPGEYVVQASSPSSAPDMRRITAAEISAGQAALQSSAAPAGQPSPLPDPGPSVAFASVFFPGTTNAASAQPIVLTAGQERGGVDFTLEFVRTARAIGTVMDPDGRPPQNARLSLSMKSAGVVDAFYGAYNSALVRADGVFVSAGLAPGHYVLTARAADPLAPNAGPTNIGSPNSPIPIQMAAPLTLWAMTEIDVNGQDVSGLVLRLQPGMTVSGKFIFESAGPPLTDLAFRTRVSLAAVTAPGASAQESAILGLGSSIATGDKDGAFSLKGAAPGAYRVSVTPPNALGGEPIPGMRTWTVKSITAGGREVLDLPIQLKPGEDVTDVVVTITDQPTDLSGTVLDSLNRPTAGFPIVVFAVDRAYWPAGTSRVRKVQPASNGKYQIAGLPPGDYYVCAVTDADSNDLKDPAFLESLAAASLKITLKAGEKRALDLKLGGGF